MKRYWFKFKINDNFQIPYGTIMGCGITAIDYEDAIDLLKMKVFRGKQIADIDSVIENVDISTLDSGHVLPNMTDSTERGVWFPLGFD